MTNQSEAQNGATIVRRPLSYLVQRFSDRGVSRRGGRYCDLSGGGASFDLPDVPPREKIGRSLGDTGDCPSNAGVRHSRIVRVFQDERGWCAGVMFASIEPRDKDRLVRCPQRRGGETTSHFTETDARATEDLWRVQRCSTARDALITRYAPLVKYVSGRVAVNHRRALTKGIHRHGTLCFIDAIERFDPSGVKFETYAIARIRGSMIDAA